MNSDKIGRYNIDRELDRGGMATVYLATDPRFNRQVAIKVLPRQFTYDPAFRERFDREARTIAQLEHNAIVPVYDFGEEDGLPFLVMRYMRGGTLTDRLNEGPMTLAETAQVLTRVAAGLDDAHAHGVIHRDLKPANILFDEHGEAYLSDFGIAKVSEASAALTGSSIIGTPAYMSPEQAKGEKGIGPTSDVYTLGVILFEMLTGQQPYKSDTPMGAAVMHITEPVPSILEVKADVGGEVARIVEKALAKDPAERYASAGELATAVASLVETGQYPKPVAPADNFPVAQVGAVPEPATAIPDTAESAATSMPPAAPPPSQTPSPAPLPAKPKKKRNPWATCAIVTGSILVLTLICVVVLPAAGILSLAGLGAVLGIETETPPPPVQIETPVVVLPTVAGEVDPIPFNAVVQIWAMFEDNSGELQVGWTGSGSIITPDGYILTNAHVVLPDRYFPVDELIVALTVDPDLPPEPAYYARVRQADEALDIAVIRIYKNLDGSPVDYTQVDLPFVPLGNSDSLVLGDAITILGYPGIGGDTITLTRGDVGGFTSQEGRGERAFIKTSATIAGGNSGGLAATEDGYLIGIPTQLGYGGDDQYVDCRVLVDTNRDGIVDENDSCVPTGGFINALRPVKLALPMIEAARRGEEWIGSSSGIASEDIPTEGDVLYEEDFSVSDVWDVGNSDNGSITYVNEGYEIEVVVDDYLIWGNAYQTFGDAVISVDAQVVNSSTEGDFGIICRYQDAGNFYGLEVTEDGYYSIWKYVDNEFTKLVDWTISREIPTSGTMTLTGACVGNTLTLAVDGAPLVEVQDNTFRSGDIGLIAGTWSNPGLRVRFDNVVVSTP
ncbi:MAG: protein kinase [Anaerolineales bacterium]|nr:protein kinase [Anaerolineales bacterium]